MGFEDFTKISESLYKISVELLAPCARLSLVGRARYSYKIKYLCLYLDLPAGYPGHCWSGRVLCNEGSVHAHGPMLLDSLLNH